ncbi:MAG: putative porin [Bacteroidia bacterium]
MNSKTAILLFFAFSFFTISSASQTPENKDSLSAVTDTVFDPVQQSRPGYGQFFYKQYLGNLGLAYRLVNFWDESFLFFNTGINQLKVYEYSEEMNKTFPDRNAHSQLRYVNGSDKEQNFTVHHLQKLSRVFSFGLDFRTAKSKGNYSNQNSNFRNFNLFTKIETHNKRYRLLLNYLSNKITAQENGGLKADSAFEQDATFDPKTAAVNFNVVSNLHKSRIYFATQQFNFTRDKKDSLHDENPRKAILLKHTFRWNESAKVFSADAYYPAVFKQVYYDSTATYDSLFAKNIYNEVSLWFNNMPAVNNLLNGTSSFYLSGNYELYDYYQRGLDTSLKNTSVKPGGSIDWKNGLGINFFYQKNINDFKFDFYKAFLELSFKQENKNRKVTLVLQNEKRNPDFISGYYNSNHFIWYNQFSPVDYSKAGLTAETKFDKQQLKVTASYYLVKNLTYFNEEVLPAQFPENIGVAAFDIYHSIKFGKFNLINDLQVQSADKKEVVRLPFFSSYTSFYYENYFFNKALGVQFGFELRYCTIYFADSYNPATGQFYLQDEKEIGNYPYIDLFVNTKIKNANLFLKSEHFNAGFFKNNYYLIPHYPMPGRTLKFGIIWDFFD